MKRFITIILSILLITSISGSIIYYNTDLFTKKTNSNISNFSNNSSDKPSNLNKKTEKQSSNAKTEKQLLNLYNSLKCLSCEGQSVLESESPFSVNLRKFVTNELQKNKSISEIKETLINIYGQEILLTPSKKNNPILWLIPIVIMIIASLFVICRFNTHKI